MVKLMFLNFKWSKQFGNLNSSSFKMLHRVEVFKLIDGLSLQVEGIEYANGVKVQGIK